MPTFDNSNFTLGINQILWYANHKSNHLQEQLKTIYLLSKNATLINCELNAQQGVNNLACKFLIKIMESTEC